MGRVKGHLAHPPSLINQSDQGHRVLKADNIRCMTLSISRRLNNLFAFSAIGTTAQFVRFRGQANIVLEGRTYHRLLDVADTGHSMH